MKKRLFSVIAIKTGLLPASKGEVYWIYSEKGRWRAYRVISECTQQKRRAEQYTHTHTHTHKHTHTHTHTAHKHTPTTSTAHTE